MNTVIAVTALIGMIALTLIWFQTYGNGLFSYVFIGVTIAALINVIMAVLEDMEIGENVKRVRNSRREE